MTPRKIYDPEWHPKLIRWMARSGLTVEQIAGELGVTRKTVTAWARKHPGLRDALDAGRTFADYGVEDSLLRRANGYDVDEVTAQQVTTDVLGDDGRPMVAPDGSTFTTTRRTVRRVKRHFAPDVMACMYWLNNRQPAAWRRAGKEAVPPPADLVVRMRPVVLPATPPPAGAPPPAVTPTTPSEPLPPADGHPA